MAKGAMPLPLWIKVVLAVLLGSTGIVYAFRWSCGLRDRNRLDQATIHRYLAEVEKIIGVPRDPVRDRYLGHSDPLWKMWSHGTQVFITLAFVALAIASLWMSAPCS